LISVRRFRVYPTSIFTLFWHTLASPQGVEFGAVFI
jgi:hypothetical protein